MPPATTPRRLSGLRWSRRGAQVGPIVLLTLGGLALLVLLALYLVDCFDTATQNREHAVVEQGFARQVEQYELVLQPQATWDKAVARLDHKFDPVFADSNFGYQLYTFNGFTRTFMTDGDGKAIYASIDGVRVPSEKLGDYSCIVNDLLPRIRASEARRGPLHHMRPGSPLPAPIQAWEVSRVSGQVFIAIASLIQPDKGLILPKGPRAPVVFTIMPIDRRALDAFAARYLLDDFHLVTGLAARSSEDFFPLRNIRGKTVAALAWNPRRPGAMLLHDLKLPLVAGFLAICFGAWLVIRRSIVVVDELISSEAQQQVAEERLAAQEERSRLNRITLVEAMTSSIAHEVNQPIGSALTYAQAARNWLSRARPDLNEALRALDGTVEQVSKAGHLIQTIRQLTGRQSRTFQPTDLHQLVRAQVAIVHSEFDRRNIALAVRETGGEALAAIPLCQADIAQVVLNLLGNALESFTERRPGQRVTIEISRDEASCAEIRVKDNGCGIPEANRDRIFNTFFTTKEGGTGLGLAICSEIAERHSGSLLVTANPEGGTIATLRLPLHQV